MDNIALEKLKQRQSHEWNIWSPRWNKVAKPSRPSKQDVDIYTSIINHHLKQTNNPTIIVLGSTPELRDLCSVVSLKFGAKIICVEMNGDIYYSMKKLMLTDNQNEELLEKNWLTMDLPDNSVDIVVGDLTDGNITHQLKNLYYAQISNSLKKTGLYVTRMVLYKSQETIKPIITTVQIKERFKKYQADVSDGSISLLQAVNYLGGELAIHGFYKNSDKKFSLSYYTKELSEIREKTKTEKFYVEFFNLLDEVWGPIRDKFWDYTYFDETINKLKIFFTDIRYEYSNDYPASNLMPILSMKKRIS